MKTGFELMEETVDLIMADPRYDPDKIGNRARIFWEVIEMDTATLERYEIIFECELRGMVIPRRLKEFAKIFRLSMDFRTEREMIETRLRRLYVGNG